MSTIDERLARLAEHLAERMIAEVSRRAVRDLKHERGGLSGDDSGLETVWAEIVDQVQGQESIFWSVYLDHLRATIDRCLDGWRPDERAVAALGTEGLTDWLANRDEGVGERPGDALCRDWLGAEIRGRVLSMAADEERDGEWPYRAQQRAQPQMRGAVREPPVIDSEMLTLGAQMAAFHIEAGVRRFADFVKGIAADLDVEVKRIRPYLRACFNGARDMMEDSGISIVGVDTPEEVRAGLDVVDGEIAYQQQMDQVAAWANAESQKLASQWPPGSKSELDLLEKWRRDRPRMSAALEQRGALLPLAHVLRHLYSENHLQFLRQGLPPTDAREEAARAWLLLEPESEDDPGNLPEGLRLLDPITLSPIARP